jgi:N-acetylneuraminic acid mutarotase
MRWADSSGNAWLFGGYGCDSTGAVGYLNDLWKYTPGENGKVGEWTWMSGSSTLTAFYGPPGVYGTQGVPASTNVPGGRLNAVSWVDSSSNLWLFGGSGVDSTGTQGQLNDLWKYAPSATGDTGQWTWMGGSTTVGPYLGQSGVCGMLGTAAATNVPGGRDGAVGWADMSGNLWLLGGQGFDCGVDTGGYMNDVWEYKP